VRVEVKENDRPAMRSRLCAIIHLLTSRDVFTLLVFHDGRNDYLEQTLYTFFDQISFPEKPYKVLIDDMPEGRDVAFLDKIAARFAFDEVILNETNLGSFGSIMRAWSSLPPTTEHIFHLENDFVFAERVDVRDLVVVLEEPSICNITLLRQPWYEDEREAGGLFKVCPEKFREAVVRGVPVCLHQDYFGHNPGLYRRSFARVIPDTSRLESGQILSHERIYRDLLLAEDPSRQFAIFGRLSDRPRVFHIGQRRVGKSPRYEPSKAELAESDPNYATDQGRALELEERTLRRRADALERHIRQVLEPAVAARERDRAAAQRAVNAQKAALAAARDEVTALRDSKSWRITAPIRRAYEVLLKARNERP
jgi:hypothetical protein